MSHLLNRSLSLHIGARSVQGALRAAWFQKRVLARSRHAFGPSTLDIDVSMTQTELEDTYREAVDAVVSELDSTASALNAHLQVVLADSRVHYDVVSGDYGGASDRHLQAIANACIGEILGDQAPNQVIRWQLQPDMRHLLISSMDTQDVEFVVQAASRHQLSLRSLQPDFCRKWNLHARSLPNGTGVFATTCSNHLIVAYAKSGSITALSCGPGANLTGLTAIGRLTKDTIDERVDRMLSNVGLNTADVKAFVLVAPDSETVSTSPRWTVIRMAEELA